MLGVDLDGVCADFFGGLREIAAEWLEVPLETLTPEVSYGLHEWNLEPAGGYAALHRFAVTQRNLFAQLRPIHGASVVLRRLSNRDVRIRIITHRLFIKYFHETAIRQTIEWLDCYDFPYWDLCFMKEKPPSAPTSTSRTRPQRRAAAGRRQRHDRVHELDQPRRRATAEPARGPRSRSSSWSASADARRPDRAGAAPHSEFPHRTLSCTRLEACRSCFAPWPL